MVVEKSKSIWWPLDREIGVQDEVDGFKARLRAI
jgi:hypothetical protein